MTNYFNLLCPACGEGDRLDILASTWVRLTSHGSDNDASHDGNHEWDDSSRYSCTCGSEGEVRDLREADG